MRKQQSDFGWDWAPKIGPAGIWQPARLVQLDKTSVYFRNTLVDIYRRGQMNNIPPDQSQPFVFNVSIDFIGSLPNGSSLQLTLVDAHDNPILDSKTLEGVYASDETITGSITIDPDLVNLWWPVGMGDQNLYHANIEIVDDNGPIATVKKTIGFRTIVLNLLNVTDSQLAAGVQPGSNWHFEVNGHEFYAKGSNLVPPDAFWPRVNETKIRKLVPLPPKDNRTQRM
jgi:beta-mannosidase